LQYLIIKSTIIRETYDKNKEIAQKKQQEEDESLQEKVNEAMETLMASEAKYLRLKQTL
jgi:hypothetical protein